MPLNATPGAADANSYLTVAEADDYFTTRLFADDWTNAGVNKDVALIQATRLIDMMLSPYNYYDKTLGYYLARSAWTGAAATDVQALAWPRIGMLDRNNFPILETDIPRELKEATAEEAIYLLKADRTVDSDAVVQGISSLKAGSVSIAFTGKASATTILPDVVYSLLVPSWLTDEAITYPQTAFFDVL